MLGTEKSSRSGRRWSAGFLVLALVGAACSSGGGDSNGGNKDKPADETATVALNALFVAQSADGTATGGANPVQIRVSPFSGDEFRVGFTEDEVAGTGDQWRAAGWQAVTAATLLTGEPLKGREVTFDVQGTIDGPSAGGAMTVGVLAAFRGDELKKNVVMTGTINPDGTIGPVGGIPQKVQGAVAVAEGKVKAIGASARAGVAPVQFAAQRPAGSSENKSDTIMLIPAGQGTSVDLETDESVDVIDLGRREGVEVKEVADVYEAYEEFTGKQLPRLDDRGDTKLDDEANQRIEATVKRWISRYEESAAEVGTLTPAGQAFVVDTGFMDSAAQAADDAQNLSDQGLQAGAYSEAVQASAFAAAAVATGRGWELGPDAWHADLDSRSAVCGEVEAVVDTLGTSDPKSVSDASGLIAAYTGTIDAVSLCVIAEDLLTRPAATADDALRDLLLAGVYFEFSDVLITGAEDQVQFARDLGGKALDKNVDVAVTADFFRRAAEANLNAFDTLIIQEEASTAGVSTDVVKGVFYENFIEYALAVGGLQVLAGLDDYFGDAEVSAYARLGGALEVYTLTSSLLAEFYSLGAELDDNLQIVGIEHDRALLAALDLGEGQLAGSIVSLRGQDVEAPSVVGALEQARLDREGEVSDKFSALSSLWTGYVGGRMLSYLGGFPTASL